MPSPNVATSLEPRSRGRAKARYFKNFRNICKYFRYLFTAETSPLHTLVLLPMHDGSAYWAAIGQLFLRGWWVFKKTYARRRKQQANKVTPEERCELKLTFSIGPTDWGWALRWLSLTRRTVAKPSGRLLMRLTLENKRTLGKKQIRGKSAVCAQLRRVTKRRGIKREISSTTFAFRRRAAE